MILKHKKLILIIALILSIFIVHTYRNRPLVTTYTSDNNNFTLTFPASWHGKYKVVEKDDSLTVCLKSFGSIDLFTITSNMNETLDSIPNVEKKQIINNKEYQIGSPTGSPFPSNATAKTRNLYAKLRYETPKVISSIQ